MFIRFSFGTNYEVVDSEQEQKYISAKGRFQKMNSVTHVIG